MLENILRHDKELFVFLNNLGNPTWDGFWMFMSNKFSAIPLYLLLLFLAFRKFGPKKTLLLLVAVALMIVVTNGLADFFKYGVQRLRPCFDPEVNNKMRLVQGYCGGKFGYFSAHAGNITAVALFFSILLRSRFNLLGIGLMLWAILVAYSRIYIGVHFPLDVLTGMALGLLFGWIFAKLFIFAQHKYLL